MVAPAVEGIDLFKVAGRSISGWVPSFKIFVEGEYVGEACCPQLMGGRVSEWEARVMRKQDEENTAERWAMRETIWKVVGGENK